MKSDILEIQLFTEYFIGGILMSLFTSTKYGFQNYNENLIMQLKIKTTNTLMDLNTKIPITSFLILIHVNLL